MTPQTLPIKAQIPPKLILLSDIVPSSNPINDIDWDHVGLLLQAYERNDPVPPIVVFPIENGKKETLFGNHRLEARRKGRYVDILATELPTRPEPLEALALQFKENNARHRLNSEKRALAFFRARQLGGLSGEQIAILFNVSPGTVSRDLLGDKRAHPVIKALDIPPKSKWALGRLPLDKQVPFYEAHKSAKAEQLVALVSEELDRLEGSQPKARPVQVTTAGGLRAWLPTTAEAALAELQRLTKAVKSVSEKGGSLADVPAWLRLNG